MISEYEPIEAFALLADDDLDLALTYDYNLAPASPEPCSRRCPVVDPGVSASPPTPRVARDIAAFADAPGSSTPATPPTKMPYAPWRRWPASPRTSPTRSTASTWSRT